jgi:UDP-N-acetylmuramate dehydrogenase
MGLMTRQSRSIPRLFLEAVRRPVRRRVSLGRQSSFRIGGKADYFFSASSPSELRACLRFVHDRSLSFYVIGAATNVLFDDDGFRGLILKNNVAGIERGPEDRLVHVWAGTPLADLVSFAREEALEGIEFAVGIPGTVGGAVFGNAGAWGHCIGELLESAVLLDGQGEEIRVKNQYFKFGYRSSVLKNKHLTVARAAFRFHKGDRSRIEEKIRENLEKRKSPQPCPKMAYAGSYFKNPVLPDGTKVAAGLLLEKVGAKQLRKGGASVYSGHANFLINRGRARAEDILALAQELKTRVKKEFGMDLEEEIIYLRADSSMS